MGKKVHCVLEGGGEGEQGSQTHRAIPSSEGGEKGGGSSKHVLEGMKPQRSSKKERIATSQSPRGVYERGTREANAPEEGKNVCREWIFHHVNSTQRAPLLLVP